jgi:hypothetical protein
MGSGSAAQAIKCSWGRHQSKAAAAAAGASAAALQLPAMQFVQGIGALGQPLAVYGAGLGPQQQGYQSQFMQPGFSPGPLSFPVRST